MGIKGKLGKLNRKAQHSPPGERICVCLLMLLAGLVLLVGTPSMTVQEHQCASDELTLPSAVRQLNSVTPRIARSLSQSSASGGTEWRRIDTVLVLPQDFATDPFSNARISQTRAELHAEAQTAVAMANRYLRPLRLVLNIVEVQDFFDAPDPYTSAVARRNAFEMLSTGISRSDSYSSKDYDLVLVLARRYFQNGTYGLSYPAVSCLSQQYSVVFATSGGNDPTMNYSLGHTIAHEVGHYLGMQHDQNSYAAGTTLMAPRFSVYPTGFSENSIAQALAHIGPGATGGSCFAPISHGRPNDSDWDGVSDAQELLDGSNPADAGSFKTALGSPVYALWNSFLGMINIIELVNPTDFPISVTVARHSLDGSVKNVLTLTIQPRKQYDLIVNQLPEFESNSYGLLKITFVGQLEGRTSFYRLATDAIQHEFAFSIPLLNPSFDKTFVSFNTNQPSLAAADSKLQVANWLTLVNIASTTKLFRINTFNQVGGLLASRTIAVPGQGRADVDGGHGFAGPGVVGLHEIIPEDPVAPYLAQLNRYGENAATFENPSQYQFAFPLIARAGTGEAVAVPLHAGTGEATWLEISNTSSSTTNVSVQYLDEFGTSLGFEQMPLNGFQQWHVSAQAILNRNGAARGTAILVADRPESLLAQSMRYFRTATGSVSAMYGEQMTEALGSDLTGSYNLFLSMENRLRLTNTLPVAVVAEILLDTADGAEGISLQLPANSTREISLANHHALRLRPDTYGLVSVQASLPGALVGSLLRTRSIGDSIDLAMPTHLR